MERIYWQIRSIYIADLLSAATMLHSILCLPYLTHHLLRIVLHLADAAHHLARLLKLLDKAVHFHLTVA